MWIMFLKALLRHRRQIGSAIWEYLWLLAHVTSWDPDGAGGLTGRVQDGTPIPTNRIADELELSRQATLLNLTKLEDGNYIVRTPGEPGQPYRGYGVRYPLFTHALTQELGTSLEARI